MQAILDTTVIVHLLRRYPPALDWMRNDNIYGVTTTTWMEVMQGTRNKAQQAEARVICAEFNLLYLTRADQEWAMQQLEQFQFSHHIGMNDCLIAAIAHRLQVRLYTHNLKDMTPLIGSLVQRPYE